MLEEIALDFLTHLIDFALGKILSIHPMLQIAIRGALIGAIGLIIWFAISIPIALLYQGLARHLRTMRVYLWILAGKLVPYGVRRFERCGQSVSEMMAESN